MIKLVALLFFSLCSVSLLSANPPPLRVVVSIAPLHSIVSYIMEGRAIPHLLIKSNISEHHYHLKPSEVLLLQNTDIFFYISDSLEGFVTSLQSKHTPYFSAIDKDPLLLSPQDSTLVYNNVHYWLDPLLMQKIASYVTHILCEKDPLYATLYKKNLKILHQRLTELDEYIYNTLHPVRTFPFIVSHDAYHYFVKRYHLNCKGVIFEDHALGSITPLHITTLLSALHEAEKSCVFKEPQLDSAYITLLLRESGTRLGTLDPLGAEIEEGRENYFTLMQNLVRSFKECVY